ncbi:MAG: class I SAM-dependent methyltransferase [Eubacterium sp.]|nr:class I SAM-dependent methyltransferase [Eubacterium sp.]
MDQSKKMLTVAKERFQAEKNRFLQMSVLELEDIEKYDVVTAVRGLSCK